MGGYPLDLSNTLFVCSGNIFRSPFAEGYFKKRSKELGLGLHGFSGGTENQIYPQPHKIVLKLAKDYGVDLSKHFARQIQIIDIEMSSAIFVMEKLHFKRIVELCPTVEFKTKYLGNFIGNGEIADVKISNIVNEIHNIQNTFKLISHTIDHLLKINQS